MLLKEVRGTGECFLEPFMKDRETSGNMREEDCQIAFDASSVTSI